MSSTIAEMWTSTSVPVAEGILGLRDLIGGVIRLHPALHQHAAVNTTNRGLIQIQID